MPNSQWRWLDRSQPQTLITATMILYFNAAFMVIQGAFFSPLGLVLAGGQVLAGLGIANEKKWGYWFGVGLVALFVAYLLYYFAFISVISLIIYGALLALLLHPQSRSYRKVWFR